MAPYTDVEEFLPDVNEEFTQNEAAESISAVAEEAAQADNEEDSQTADGDSDTADDPETEEWTQLLNLDDHNRYISGYESGFFLPDGNLTRARQL